MIKTENNNLDSLTPKHLCTYCRRNYAGILSANKVMTTTRFKILKIWQYYNEVWKKTR